MATDLKARKAVTPPALGIRGVRELLNLSLLAMANRISRQGYTITKAGLGNIETGVRGPSVEFLEAWRAAVDEAARELTGGQVTTPPAVFDRAPRASATGRAA